ncbi:acetyltransferase [Olivibacter sp. LS-1]|uniref:acetyltransferase n=1 Tax=unclassified Olivibacter TaxID=2632301 RepID=UPI0011EAA9A6|nr:MULTISPECIES: acetyltransferase [unclassified Olivibacter]MDM8177227.1 acetyltransferase [Olivibacter sp. 47]QEL00382.1 acetyltransferase [Olivibacter sp. LS-1]
MQEVYLIGASGHAKVIAEVLLEDDKYIKGIFEKNEAILRLWDYRVLPQPEAGTWPRDAPYVIAVGSNRIRKYVAETFQNELTFSKAIHPRSIISNRVSIGEGTVVMAGVTINTETLVGKHVILNTNCSVDHECVLADYVHISPGVSLAGDVQVGEGTHIGIGASVIQGVRIGKWCTIGAGAVVIRDVPDYAVVVGSPGRIIKYNQA